jgi:hypothetical protein
MRVLFLVEKPVLFYDFLPVEVVVPLLSFGIIPQLSHDVETVLRVNALVSSDLHLLRVRVVEINWIKHRGFALVLFCLNVFVLVLDVFVQSVVVSELDKVALENQPLYVLFDFGVDVVEFIITDKACFLEALLLLRYRVSLLHANSRPKHYFFLKFIVVCRRVLAFETHFLLEVPHKLRSRLRCP